MKVEIKSVNQFKEEINAPKVLVDFGAEWCGYCKMIAPVIDEVQAAHPELKVLTVDVDEVGALAQMFGVSSIPALLYIENGEVVRSGLGFMPKPKLESFLGF